MNRQQLVKNILEKQSYLCVGLDTNISKMPLHLRENPDAMWEFNKAIIDATQDYCVAYKINSAFYEAFGARGWEVMQATFDYIPSTHFKIADAKRGDIGNTSDEYARAFFEQLKADAVTVVPYMGHDSIRPFLAYKDKWTIILALTSNAGSEDFQRLPLQKSKDGLSLIPDLAGASGRTSLLYEHVLTTTSGWAGPDQIMFVAGATQAKDFSAIREIVPGNFLLVPGVGFQGGSLAEVSEYGMTDECGLLVNASRAIIYASDDENFAEEAGAIAAEYQNEMKTYLKEKGLVSA